MHIFGVLLTILGSCLLAAFAIGQRKAFTRGEENEDRPHESVLLAGTYLVAAGVLYLAFLCSGQPIQMRANFWIYGMTTGLLNVAISYCGFKAVASKEDVSIVIPIRDTTPAIIVFTAWFITGERPSAIGYLGVLFLVMGTYTLNVHTLMEKLHGGKWTWIAFLEPWKALSRSTGVRFAFLGSLIGCVAITFDGLASRSAHPLFALAYVLSFPAIMHLTRVIIGGRTRQLFDARRAMPKIAFGLGLLYASAGACYFVSFRFLLVAYQATVKRTETFLVLVFAYFLLGERKNFRSRMAAVALMVIGTVLIAK